MYIYSRPYWLCASVNSVVCMKGNPMSAHSNISLEIDKNFCIVLKLSLLFYRVSVPKVL